jgi:hypothetical protein
MSKTPSDLLKNILASKALSYSEQLSLKNSLQPIFYGGKGFMEFVRNKTREETKKKIQLERILLINQFRTNPDELIEELLNSANNLNQGSQLQLFYNLPNHFPKFKGDKLNVESKELLNQLQEGINSNNNLIRNRVIQVISLFAESSNIQSRKSRAGGIAEEIFEDLLISLLKWKKGIDYGTQFVYKGSNTDFIVPAAADGKIKDVRATIAVQLSTNDRARLSSSELQKGTKRYLCSFNGCSASKKSTKDIGDDLAAGYYADDIYYVVIDKEKSQAIRQAKERLKKNRGTNKEENSEYKLKWLEEWGINYQEFLRQIKELRK